MNKWVLIVLALAGGFYFLKKSAPSRAKSPAFEGRYVIEMSSEVAGSSSVRDVRVKTDGRKFRLEETSSDNSFGQAPSSQESVMVFDGENLHERFTYAAYSSEEPAPEPETVSGPAEDPRLKELKFWEDSFIGNAGPGGKIAGRDTVLYQARENRNDSEMTVQAWVDAETGVVLRSNVSAYSKQVNAVVSKTTIECKDIRFGPVDGAAFLKP